MKVPWVHSWGSEEDHRPCDSEEDIGQSHGLGPLPTSHQADPKSQAPHATLGPVMIMVDRLGTRIILVICLIHSCSTQGTNFCF